ncbi:MAG TPA: hypothetical protein VMN79_16965 [Casimicrobiaceae bacterium]|nr:hypothetical protein [Casimicrobiaceae bacterium]
MLGKLASSPVPLAVFGAWIVAASIRAEAAEPAKTTECTRIGICYCVSADAKAAIGEKVERFRALIADAHKAGKAVGYLSVPLSPAGGGYFNLNAEVAERTKAAIEQRFGAQFVWVLNPGTTEANLPKRSSGADYMLMWTSILEGREGLGEDFDFVYFAGPQDFARVFGLDGSGDMAKIDQYFDQRLKTDPELDKAVKAGLTKAAFRNYYGLKASSAASRGSHDEWNIVRAINERRRAEPKLGIANQLPVLFDGRSVPAVDAETFVSEGYVGQCKM